MNPQNPHEKHEHLKVRICVSGAAEMGHLDPKAHETAKQLGESIVKHGGITLTGATTGYPFWAAMGTKKAGGISIGLSPAATEREHVEAWKLPLDYMDIIIYTGSGFPGRDILLTRTSDAVIIGPGRIGTFHEFTVAYEDAKPIGILESDMWETDEIIKLIIQKSNRPADNIIFDRDPERLVTRIIDMVKARKINDAPVDRGVRG